MAIAELSAPSRASDLAPSERWTPRPVPAGEWIESFMRTALAGASTPAQLAGMSEDLHRLVDRTVASVRLGVPA